MNLEDLARDFEVRFDGLPNVIGVAPGRVNLIGEHTDYNDGFVFPVAIDREIHVAARIVDGPSILHSEETGPGCTFNALTVEPGQVEGWARYAAGMAWVLTQHTGCVIPNVEAMVASDLPIGSGLSSSAALEMAFGIVFNNLAALDLDNQTLALLAQKCENDFVGVNCGIMDPMASAMGRVDNAMFLDTRSLEIDYAPIPDSITMVVCDTKKPRALTESAYNERRSQCQEACTSLGVPFLRDTDQTELERAKSRLSDIAYRRAKHVVRENARCIDFRKALLSGQKSQLGELMRASHISLRDDYEVSSLELDAMVEACLESPGCIGARMTGAGFGGACIALVETEVLDRFVENAGGAYHRRTQIVGCFSSCRASNGAHAVRV